jgi:hypothetical protein
MMNAPLVILTTLALTACVASTAAPPAVTNSQDFALADGSTITVRHRGLQADLIYLSHYRLTDAEAASYIEDGTGCRAGALQGSMLQDDGVILRNYSLICS